MYKCLLISSEKLRTLQPDSAFHPQLWLAAASLMTLTGWGIIIIKKQNKKLTLLFLLHKFLFLQFTVNIVLVWFMPFLPRGQRCTIKTTINNLISSVLPAAAAHTVVRAVSVCGGFAEQANSPQPLLLFFDFWQREEQMHVGERSCWMSTAVGVNLIQIFLHRENNRVISTDVDFCTVFLHYDISE